MSGDPIETPLRRRCFDTGGEPFGIPVGTPQAQRLCRLGVEVEIIWRGMFFHCGSTISFHACHHVHVLNHFFVGMPADFAIRLPRRVVEDFLL